MKSKEVFIGKIGVSILFTIGSHAEENFAMIDASKKEDIWFHVQGKPSCHVIAHLPDNTNYDRKEIAAIVKQGSCICKQFSKYASEKNLSIIYSCVGEIEKTDRVGSVLTNERAKLISI